MFRPGSEVPKQLCGKEGKLKHKEDLTLFLSRSPWACTHPQAALRVHPLLPPPLLIPVDLASGIRRRTPQGSLGHWSWRRQG